MMYAVFIKLLANLVYVIPAAEISLLIRLVCLNPTASLSIDFSSIPRNFGGSFNIFEHKVLVQMYFNVGDIFLQSKNIYKSLK